MRYPDIHNEQIVFTYEDDLWLVSSQGGTAVRITSHPGTEQYAKFSPDGEWIAFTGEYDGGRDIYVIPASGGEPRRLTYHPADDEVVEWKPDGKAILFRSKRDLETRGYLVSIDGTFPEMLPVDRLRYGSFSPDGSQIAYNRNNSDRMNWKGYKGGRQQDIWIADFKDSLFQKMTTYRGYDNFPMWYEETIFFNSDREDGRMNLFAYSLVDHQITRKTVHKEWDVEFPSLGSEQIVYGCEGYLWIYDIPSEKTEKISIDIPSDRWLTRETHIDPSEYIQDITLSQTGEMAIAQARGDIYLLKEDEIINISQTSPTREMVPTLSPDSLWIAFFSDKTGEYELYITKPEEKQTWIQLTDGLKTTPYHILWSPDSKKLLFGDKDYKLYWLDIEEKNLTEIDRALYQKDNEIYWEISEYDWSPDSKWIVYSKCEKNMNSSIFLYNLESKQITQVTDDRYDDTSPGFDKNGEVLYFLSLRNFEPMLDPFMDNNINGNMSMIFYVELQSEMASSFTGDGEKAEEQKSIDLDGLTDRIFPVSVRPGTYKRLIGCQNGFFYLAKEQFGFPTDREFYYPKFVTTYSLYKYDMQRKREYDMIHGIGYYNISGDGSKIAYFSGNITGVIDAVGESFVGEGSLNWHDIRQKVNIFQEYTQIFHDVWRQIRDFFYDPQLHGKDWPSIRNKYEPLISSVGNRSDLNYLLGQMIGELMASHEYILHAGDNSRRAEDKQQVNTGLLGADLEPEMRSGRYRFNHIIRGINWDRNLTNPLEAPDIEINEGDYLLSIDHVQITTEENYLKYLIDKGGKEITITVNSKPDTANARTYTIESMPLTKEMGLRQHEWVENNYKKVKDKTNGQIGYIHLSDMDEKGIQEFEQGFRAERLREGLIIDVRNNRGGFVSWFLIDKLERKISSLTQTRDFNPMAYPHGVHMGPTVFICDETTSSDGEIFIHQVQENSLGLVIGTDTWGGLIGYINIIPTVDDGMVTQSNVGFADLEGNWLIENEGAHPDIVVENTPGDILSGRDPQLDRAIEWILENLEKNPPITLKSPPFPER